MKKLFPFLVFIILNNTSLTCQILENKVYDLDSIIIEGVREKNIIKRLDPIQGTYIFSGKKNENLSLTQMDANICEKNARQIFSKVPGIFVYDMEGGNQMNIATRGLDPHRGWEFNMRKDGIIINSDMYGYPASHYSIPLESIERIELVRGTGSLQYGAQFGGMINYISKTADPSKKFSFENYSSFGSYNLLSNYISFGTNLKKIKIYAYLSKRNRDGYRDNEHTKYDAQGINLQYSPTKNLSLNFDYARSFYLYQLPGPLTDSMFYADPTQSTRSRNYFNPIINVPSITLKWKISPKSKMQFVSSALIGTRNSILFDKPATIQDSINRITLQYENRQVDVDRFNSYTQELRYLQQFNIGNFTNHIAGGLQLMTNDLHRTQLGKGSRNSDFDINLVDPIWGRDLHFKTQNIAAFVENNFEVTKNFSINVGARFETGESKLKGTIVYYPDNEIPVSIKHQYPLLGTSFTYHLLKKMEIYGGYSQTYRPLLFKDLIPSSTFEKIDPKIKDAKGYNAEIGFRGKYRFLQFDITGFLLQYNNRFGTLAFTDAQNNFYTYRTNIGNSLTKGVEIFLQAYWYLNNVNKLTVFNSSAIMDGRYTSGTLKSGNNNIDIEGNKIESVPNLISRNGITYQYRKFSISLLHSYTASNYADAFNTELPSRTGAVGLVPSYQVLDVNTTLKINKMLEFKIGINNLMNEKYFSKRPLFYPGPGVWPSDGRNGSVSILLKL